MSLEQDLAKLTPEELSVKAAEAQEALYALARDNFPIFCQLVAKDDETGLPIKFAPIHHRWSHIMDTEKRALIWSSVHSGKTTICSILRSVWEIGRDASIRIGICSSTGENAEKIVSAISGYIEESEEVKKIFPKLLADKNAKWTKRQLTVKRESRAHSPTVRGFGTGVKVSGMRLDLLILDDALDHGNSLNATEREKVKAWYTASLPGRLTRRARVVCVGTAWHPGDLYHALGQMGFTWHRFPALDVKTGLAAWPENWPPERIEEKRRELGPAEFARQMLCRVRDEAAARFKTEWFDAAKERGQLCEIIHEMEEAELPPGARIIVGVDLASGKKNSKRKKTDETIFFIALIHANEDRQILKIESGKWSAPLIIGKIKEIHERYPDPLFVVEDAGAQIYIQQFITAETSIPIVPHTTTAEKWDITQGVEGLSIELFNKKWVVPNKNGSDPDIEKWIEDCLFFSPTTHTGDRLMASYFIREWLRLQKRKSTKAGVKLRILGGGKMNKSVADDEAAA